MSGLQGSNPADLHGKSAKVDNMADTNHSSETNHTPAIPSESSISKPEHHHQHDEQQPATEYLASKDAAQLARDANTLYAKVAAWKLRRMI
jgi:hypothetical protein